MTTKIYEVKPGQSLSIIARDVLGDMSRWKELAFINSIQYPYIIKVGEIIELPELKSPPQVIEVAKGVPTVNASITNMAADSLSPATVILLVVGAFLLLTGGKK